MAEYSNTCSGVLSKREKWNSLAVLDQYYQSTSNTALNVFPWIWALVHLYMYLYNCHVWYWPLPTTINGDNKLTLSINKNQICFCYFVTKYKYFESQNWTFSIHPSTMWNSEYVSGSQHGRLVRRRLQFKSCLWR